MTNTTVHVLCVTCRNLEISVVFYVFCVFFTHRSYAFSPYWSPTPGDIKLLDLIRFSGLLYVIEFFKTFHTFTFRILVGGRPHTIIVPCLTRFFLLKKQVIKLQFFYNPWISQIILITFHSSISTTVTFISLTELSYDLLRFVS